MQGLEGGSADAGLVGSGLQHPVGVPSRIKEERRAEVIGQKGAGNRVSFPHKVMPPHHCPPLLATSPENVY